jgi:hypothetical protein
MTWKRILLTLKALLKHLVQTELIQMTRKKVILTLKSIAEVVGEDKVEQDDVEEDDPDLESIAGSSS